MIRSALPTITGVRSSNSLGDSTAMIDIIQYRNYSVEVIDEEIDQGFEDESRYVAFIIKDDSTFIPVRLDVGQFDKAFASYRNSLKFGIKDKLSYGVFWEPIDAQLPDINKIYLSPDGIYHKLNPVVFYDEQTAKYMADKYNVVNITSGKDLAVS